MPKALFQEGYLDFREQKISHMAIVYFNQHSINLGETLLPPLQVPFFDKMYFVMAISKRQRVFGLTPLSQVQEEPRETTGRDPNEGGMMGAAVITRCA
jgi:hypothetical protein